MQISRKINDRKDQAEALENISEIFLSQGKTKEAITYLQKAAAIADSYDFRNLKIIYENRDSWSILQEDSTDLKLCSTFIDTLKSNHDPRLPIISWIYATGDTASADQLGLPPGYIIGGNNPAYDITKTSTWDPVLGMERYSRLSDVMLSYTAPNLILTYAESEFYSPMQLNAGELAAMQQHIITMVYWQQSHNYLLMEKPPI